MYFETLHTQISLMDIFALLYFLLCWKGYTYYAERDRKGGGNLLNVTNEYRLNWMMEMMRRDNRNMDSIMIGNLARSITFFANTSIFILLGLVTLIGYQDMALNMIKHIPYAADNSGLLWEIKIFLLIIIFVYAFFKYTWSLRQYNYAGIFICAAPPYDTSKEQDMTTIAKRGASLVANAAKHFNLGLRAYYFGLAVLSWFVNPVLFIVATTLVIWVTYRREYKSNTLTFLR